MPVSLTKPAAYISEPLTVVTGGKRFRGFVACIVRIQFSELFPSHTNVRQSQSDLLHSTHIVSYPSHAPLYSHSSTSAPSHRLCPSHPRSICLLILLLPRNCKKLRKARVIQHRRPKQPQTSPSRCSRKMTSLKIFQSKVRAKQSCKSLRTTSDTR